MTSMVKRFFVGVAIVGSFVTGSFGVAQAIPEDGPYTWLGTYWPSRQSPQLSAQTSYCWLTSFNVGTSPGTVDQVYVFIDASGNWQISGSGKTAGTAPSAGASATAYCIPIDYLFAPLYEYGPVNSLACASLTDNQNSGLKPNGDNTCFQWTTGSGLASFDNYTWVENNPNFKNNDWTNAFVNIEGVAFDGLAGGNPNPEIYPPNGTYFQYVEQPLATAINNNGDNRNGWTWNVSYGAVWPEDNEHWFCAEEPRADERCVAQQLVYGDSNNPQLSANNYICTLNQFQASGAQGEAGVQLTISSSGYWQLGVSGTVQRATAYCFPFYYNVNDLPFSGYYP